MQSVKLFDIQCRPDAIQQSDRAEEPSITHDSHDLDGGRDVGQRITVDDNEIGAGAGCDTPCLQPQYVSRCIGRSRARTGLIALAELQAARLRERGSYAENAAFLGFAAESGMVLRMRAGPDGWSAEYHSAVGGVGCAVYGGEVEEPFETIGGLLPASPDAVACDDPLAGGR